MQSFTPTALSALVLVVGLLIVHAIQTTATVSPCEGLNSTLTPDPNYEITRSQVEEGEIFLDLLLNNSSMPSFNASLNISVDFARTVHDLIAVAQSYPLQATFTLKTLRGVVEFCQNVNATFLSTLEGVYQAFVAASGQPERQAQIRKRFAADQKLWTQSTATQVSVTNTAMGPWNLDGQVRDTYKRLNGFLRLCGDLPNRISMLEKLIAMLNKTCIVPCPALEKAEAELAQVREELIYCNSGSMAYATKLFLSMQRMTGDLWGKVLSILHVMVDDLGNAGGEILKLNLDSVIFDLDLQAVIAAWASLEVESYSSVHYACLNGFIPKVP